MADVPLSFVLYQELSLVDPSLKEALEQYVRVVRDVLRRLSDKKPFRIAAFHEAVAAPADGTTQGSWQLGIVVYQYGQEVGRFSLEELLQAQVPQPGTSHQWDNFDIHQRGPAVARVLRMLRLPALWKGLNSTTRSALDAAFAPPQQQEELRQLRLSLAQFLDSDEALYKSLPHNIRAQLRKVIQHVNAEKEGLAPLDASELDSLLESISVEVKIELPRLLKTVPATSTADLANLLNQLQAAELAATSPAGALSGLVSFIAHHVAEFQDLPRPPSSPLASQPSPLPALLPVHLLRRAWRLLRSVRLPNPNRIARQAKLRGEIVALTLLEGVHDFWELSCKLTRVFLKHSKRAVKPLIFAVILSRVTSALLEARDPWTVMQKLPAHERVDYYYSKLLGPDWKEQIQRDLLEAVDEVRQGLITDHMIEEKKLLSAAILRRLDRAAYDRMAQYMAFDMFHLNENYKNAEDGESEEMMRWKQIQDKIYDWFYVISRFGKNAHEWAGKIKTYPQDLDPWMLDFNAWAKDLIQTGYQKHLPAPSLINDEVDPVHVLASTPGFSALDPVAVNAALLEKDPVKRGKINLLKPEEPKPEVVVPARVVPAKVTTAHSVAVDQDDEDEWETATETGNAAS